MSVTANEFIYELKRRADRIDNTRVYFVLRKMRLRPVRVHTVELVKLCIAINEAGLPITNTLMSSITNKTECNSNVTLHILGDRKILTILRDDKYMNRWIISDMFKSYYYEPPRTLDVQETKMSDKLSVTKV